MNLSNKAKSNIFHILSFVVSAGCPIWATLQKFREWNVKYHPSFYLGVSCILICATLVITFRKTIFEVIKKRINLSSIPPVGGWIIFLSITLMLNEYMVFIQDMKTIAIAGIVGCCIGMALSYIGTLYDKKDTDEELTDKIRTAIRAEKESVDGEDSTK